MDQFSNDNMYIIDLGSVNTTPEIIFELSSILDKEEAKNRRICLKLGDIDLNQAQLLSIKSLISGIDSVLSCIDTKSVETEKVALSLGIIVSNISAENTLEVSPEAPYKMAEDLKENLKEELKEVINEVINEEHNIPEQRNEDDENYHIVEESDLIVSNNPQNYIIVENSQEENSQTDIIQPDITKEENIQKENIQENIPEQSIENNQADSVEENNSTDNNTDSTKENMQDELDIIFGSNPVNSNIFNTPKTEDLYEEREELSDIVVPEQEYTKEDIELEAFPTKYIKQTLRSGQVINYEGNVVIIGDCHPGCEITAFGDITVWGILSGIAHAGSGGNQKARVRALKMNAIQLRIANCYSRRPDSLNTVYIEKTNSFTPEEARIINGEIVVFKIND